MKNKKVILLILAILAVLTLVSVLVVQKMKKDEVLVVNSNENVNQNVNEIVKKEPEIIDGVDISDWKTYVNEDYKYSIRYPLNWRVDNDNDLDNKKIFIVPFNEKNKQSITYEPIINIEVTSKNITEFIKEYNLSDVSDNGVSFANIISQEKIDFNGMNAVKLVGTSAIGGNTFFIFLERDKKNYIISFFDLVQNKNSSIIISTFKFLE